MSSKRQTQNFTRAKQILAATFALFSICPVNRSILETALKSGLNDFEDAVHIACAQVQNLEAIITRNPQDF